MAATGAALREFLLAIERAKQPLDGAIVSFVDAVASDARVLPALLDVDPQAQQLLHIWPDESGKGTRWEDRESIARFLELLTRVLQASGPAAEALALRVVRDKSASLEKLLSWSDKPVVEFRVLELLTAVVRTSAAAARELVRVFGFQGAAFAKIASRRLKKPLPPATPEEEEVAKPTFQIRRAYVTLVVALASCHDKSVYRFALKENGVVASLFKGLDGDDAELLPAVLEHLDRLALQNKQLDNKARVAIFNSFAVQQLLAVVKADDDAVAGHALRMITRLLVDNGAVYALPATHSLRVFLLKPSATTTTASAIEDDPAGKPRDGLGHATKVLRNVVAAVSVADYLRSESVRVLVDRLATAYPGLVPELLAAAAPQLEPKPGYRWFAVASMVQRLLALPLDAVLPDLAAPVDMTGGYSAALLATKLVLPVSCRKELSRGLQHGSSLVVYASLGVVESALRRFQFLLPHVLSATSSSSSSSELATELRFLLPTPEVLVSLLLKLSAMHKPLVYLRALTVLRLYLECLPQAMGDVKADYTKLLAWDVLQSASSSSSTSSAPLHRVVLGELLRVLLALDESRLQYVVASAAKLAPLLQLLVEADGAVRVLVRGVLHRVLQALRLFGEDEVGVWLDHLPSGGADATRFVERLLQGLVADPFALLPSGEDEQGSSSSAASPATLALVAALTGEQMGELRPSVVAFGARVLLSLLAKSSDAVALARLLVGDGGGGGGDVLHRASKKRRLLHQSELPSDATPLQRVQAIALRLMRPSAEPLLLASQADGASSPWPPAATAAQFLDALFALDAAAFQHSLPSIVEDLVRLELPAAWLHAYLLAHPEVDLDALLAAKKPAVLRDLAATLPLPVLAQRLLWLAAVGASVDKPARLLVARLQSSSADCSTASVVELLLLTVRLLHGSSSSSSSSDRVLGHALVLAFARAPDRHRLEHKLRGLLRGAAPPLAAAGLVASALGSGGDALLPSTVVDLVVRLPRATRDHRLLALSALLPSAASAKKVSHAQALLLTHVLQSLDSRGGGGGERVTPNSSLRPRLAALLASLRREVTAGGTPYDLLRSLSAGLHVLHAVGGEASPPLTEIQWGTDCVRAVLASPSAAASLGDLVLFVRRLIRHDTRLATAVTDLLRAHATSKGSVVAAAALLVATGGEDETFDSVAAAALRETLHSDQASSPASLAVLYHTATRSSLLATADAACASLARATPLSKDHALALLLALRHRDGRAHTVSRHFATWLLRSAIATGEVEEEWDDGSDSLPLRVLHLIVRDVVSSLLSPEDLTTVLSAVSPAVDQCLSSPPSSSFRRFVLVSRVLSAAALPSSTALRHLAVLTAHPSFPSGLTDAAVAPDLLRLLALLLRQAASPAAYSRELFTHLLAAYSASLSRRDRILRVLLADFEAHGVLLSQYGYRFGAAVVPSSSSSSSADGSPRSDLADDSAWFLSDGGALDAARVRATIDRFPLHRAMDVSADRPLLLQEETAEGDQTEEEGEETEEDVYDPSFLLPLVARLVAASSLPDAAIAQHGVLGLALRAASSAHADVRAFAFAILAHVHEALSADAAADFKPGRQVHLLLDALRKALPSPLSPVASVVSVFLNDALALLARPAHALYPAVNQFLLARPQLDLHDVPMFYTLFNSHAPHTFRQERSWLLHALRRGVRADADVALLVRRHAPALLTSFAASALADDHTQRLVGHVLAAMLATDAGAAHLLGKAALLDWAAAQLQATAVPVDVLASLLLASLQSPRWHQIDAAQLDALSCSTVRCLEALAQAVATRGLALQLGDRLAQCQALVLARCQRRCPLATLVAMAASPLPIEMAEALLSADLEHHPEFTSLRFDEWSVVLSAAVEGVAAELPPLLQLQLPFGRLDRAVRARAVLRHTRALLLSAPSLQRLVRRRLPLDLPAAALLH